MTMDSVAGQNSVLKLVFPGGVVETYTKPITAAEVMRKYPRHCVTRPDVFKYPWIVVRPESVLNPGQNFFVVPYHTIRRLLERNGYRNHSSPGQVDAHNSVIKETQVCHRRKKITSPPEYYSWVKVAADQKHHHDSGVDHHPFLYELTLFYRQMQKQSPNESLCNNKENYKNEDFDSRDLKSKSPDDQFVKKEIPLIKLLAQLKMQKEDSGAGAAHDSGRPARKQYPVERWPTEIKPPTPDDSLVKAANLQNSRDYASDYDGAAKNRRRLLFRNDDGSKINHSQHYGSDHDGAAKSRRRLSSNNDGSKIKHSQNYVSDNDGAGRSRRSLSSKVDRLKMKYSQQITENKPKSILKKHKRNISKSKLRVSFALPDEDQKELRIEVSEL